VNDERRIDVAGIAHARSKRVVAGRRQRDADRFCRLQCDDRSAHDARVGGKCSVCRLQALADISGDAQGKHRRPERHAFGPVRSGDERRNREACGNAICDPRGVVEVGCSKQHCSFTSHTDDDVVMPKPRAQSLGHLSGNRIVQCAFCLNAIAPVCDEHHKRMCRVDVDNAAAQQELDPCIAVGLIDKSGGHVSRRSSDAKIDGRVETANLPGRVAAMLGREPPPRSVGPSDFPACVENRDALLTVVVRAFQSSHLFVVSLAFRASV
jgi:hypothetical protein